MANLWSTRFRDALASGPSGGGLLALSYRISRDTVHKYIKRAEVPFHERGLTDEQKTEAERLYLAGWSLQRLADRDGKDDETIRRISRSGSTCETRGSQGNSFQSGSQIGLNGWDGKASRVPTFS